MLPWGRDGRSVEGVSMRTRHTECQGGVVWCLWNNVEKDCSLHWTLKSTLFEKQTGQPLVTSPVFLSQLTFYISSRSLPMKNV